MKKTLLERYTAMVKSKLVNIENIKAVIKKKGNGTELEMQLKNEIKSLDELLTNKYYRKILQAESKEIYNKYIKGC